MSPRAVEQEVPSYPSRPMLRGREEEEDEEEEEEEEEGKEEEEQGEKRFTGSHQSWIAVWYGLRRDLIVIAYRPEVLGRKSLYL